MKVMPPGLEGTDDSEEFMIIDIVILFCWGKGLEKI